MSEPTEAELLAEEVLNRHHIRWGFAYSGGTRTRELLIEAIESYARRQANHRVWFVVNSGPMTSTGSKGATFIGHNSPRADEVARYRSNPGET